MHNERLTIATICDGAVQEKIDRALEKVARNILDPNTDQTKKRSITLKIVFTPDKEDCEDVAVTADVTVSLASELGVATRLFVNKDLKADKVVVMEHKKGEIKGQLDFSDLGMEFPGKTAEAGEVVESETVDNVIDLRRKQG